MQELLRSRHEADRTVCRCSTLYEIMTKHFQHFKTAQRYFLVWKKVFFIQEWSDFFPIIGHKSPKSDKGLTDLFWLQTSVWAILSALARYREPKEMSARDNCFRGYGYTWNWLSHCDDDASISHNNENRTSLLTSPPFKGYREKSIASGKRKETQEPRRGERKWELFVSPAPPPPRDSPHTLAFASHSRLLPPRNVIRVIMDWLCAFAIQWASFH